MRLAPHLRVLFVGFLFGAAAAAHASIGLVVGEPFGAFGTMMPQGHANIYLDNICVQTPTQVRSCRADEHGSVVARFHDLKAMNLDWMAVPAGTFFYGADDAEDVPTFVTSQLSADLREQYREQHLESVVPDRVDRHGETRPPPYGDWEEAIGASFDRRLFLYVIDTTPAQDAAIIERLNTDPNRRRYTLVRDNCADFAAELLSIVLPGVLHRNVLADFDMTTPKNLARLVDSYGRTHPELHLHVYEIPQLPGTARRSRPLRGAAESLLTTKRYLFTLLAIQPELVLADWIVYESKGRWKPGQDASLVDPQILLASRLQSRAEPIPPSKAANPPLH